MGNKNSTGARTGGGGATAGGFSNLAGVTFGLALAVLYRPENVECWGLSQGDDHGGVALHARRLNSKVQLPGLLGQSASDPRP